MKKLTVEFLEDRADGLRLVKQFNWSGECFICSRSALPASLGKEKCREALDNPGVYLLVGPPEKSGDTLHRDSRLYVGQADSVADRLDSHLKSDSKTWWQTVVAVGGGENPLNLTQCGFLESRLYTLASEARTCVLTNKNTPHLPSITEAGKEEAGFFLDNAIVIVSALGFNLFESAPPPGESPDGGDVRPPQVPTKLQQLLDDLRKAATGPSFPKAQWYWTRTPDYRAKIVSGGNFRVFLRVRWNKNSLRISLKEIGKFNVGDSADLDNLRDALQAAYSKADGYLQGDK